MVIQGTKYPSDFEAKKAMIDTAKRLSDKGYLIGTDGSLSVRVGPNAIWITISDADKGALTQDMMVRIDMNGKQMMNSQIKTLPEDLAIHLKAYGQNNSLRSVIHAYPPMANAMGMKGKAVSPANYSPAVRKLGAVSLIQGLNPDSAAAQISSICSAQKGALLLNDGCVFWGESVNEAYYNIEAVEYYAKMEELVAGEHCCQNCRSGENSNTSLCTGNCSVCPLCGTVNCQKHQNVLNTVMPAVSQTPVSQVSQLKGLTPLVRPGDANRHITPSKAQEIPKAVPTAPAQTALPYVPHPVNASALTIKTPVFQPGQTQDLVAVKDVAKEIVMQEVVNKTLMKFKK